MVKASVLVPWRRPRKHGGREEQELLRTLGLLGCREVGVKQRALGREGLAGGCSEQGQPGTPLDCIGNIPWPSC